MTRAPATLDALPLFADDAAIGRALLGTARAGEWKQLAPLYEAQGLPKIDPVMGGRYWPAVISFFDRQYNLIQITPAASPDGAENPGGWKANAHKRRA